MDENILGIGNIGTGGSLGSNNSGVGFSEPRRAKQSDQSIEENVNTHISSHSEIPSATISAKVKDGVVILSGTAANQKTKEFLEDEIGTLTGVLDVKNELLTSEPPL